MSFGFLFLLRLPFAVVRKGLGEAKKCSIRPSRVAFVHV